MFTGFCEHKAINEIMKAANPPLSNSLPPKCLLENNGNEVLGFCGLMPAPSGLCLKC